MIFLFRWVLILIPLLSLFSGAPLSAAEPPNMIIIFCDNLGYGDIEPFGSTVHRTPNLNRMAREGRKFTHFCVTAGVCTPSRASILTGCYSQRVGMHNNPRGGRVLRPVSPYGLHPKEVTVAELLKQRGYKTGIIGKWHLGDQPEFLPTRQGFDFFFGIPYSDDMTQSMGKRLGKRLEGNQWPPLPLMEDETVIEAPADRDLLTKRYTERAVNFIEQNKDHPFFLYFPQAMPGSTRTPFASPEFKGKSRNGSWGDSVEELDWSTGKILDKLVDLGIEKRTLVVWTSDNGAPTAGNVTDFSRGSNLPLGGRGYTTAEGAFRVPTIMWQPGTIPADTVCDELATTMDLLPTFARLAGVEKLPQRKIDGHDIQPLIQGEPNAKSPYDAFFYYAADQLQAVRSGPWKLFLPLKEFVRHPYFKKGDEPTPLLFNVVNDVGSTRNVAASHPEIVKQLTTLAEEARKDLGDKGQKGIGQRPVGHIAKPTPRILTNAQLQIPNKDKGKDQRPNKVIEPAKQGALDSIESTRGGRHWVKDKTALPKSPEDSLKCFQIEPGLQIEVVAAEPLVMDPVAIAFDARGRMFVVEYGDYPTGPAEIGAPPLSRVVLLEDDDNDGRMDRRHVFADQLTFAHSLMAFKGGILVCAQTQILYLKDTNGDKKADVREVLFSGFKPAHPQMQIGNPRWGFDNWVYLNYGPGNISTGKSANPATSKSKSVSEMPRKEFRFDPLSLEFGPASGLGQFGNTIDNFGRRFFSTNRNPIMAAPISHEYLLRNPFTVVPKDHYSVGPAGGATQVYPLVEMKSNYLSHAGTHTSACGTTAYRGDLLGTTFENSVFVCEPIGHLVTRSIVKSDGSILTAERARPKADFLASTDTWFRPASLATGPDGALYLADMYRLWVEHPKFLPEEIAKQLDWRAGEDRGRIWRVIPKSKQVQRKEFVPPESTSDLVAMLADPNGWRRQLAQRLLVERQAKDAVSQLRKILTVEWEQKSGLEPHDAAFARLHAMWTLEGLGKLTASDVIGACNDSNATIRCDAVKLLARFLREDNSVLKRLPNLTADPDPRVRFELALSLGEIHIPDATKLLTELARQDGEDEWFATALLTSTMERSGDVLTGLIGHDPNIKPTYIHLVRELASIVGARGDQSELTMVLNLIGRAKQPGVWWQNASLTGLATGLSRHKGTLGRITLAKLLDNPPEPLVSSVEPVRSLIEQTADVALSENLSNGDRVAAIELLGYQAFEKSADTYLKLLATGQPLEVQLASVEAMQNTGNSGAAKIILKQWPESGPQVRQVALKLLLRRSDSTRHALEAMASGDINPAIIDIDQRVRLLRHADASIKRLAEKLFGGAVSANRREVARQYAVALTMKASATEGMKVFDRTCSKCHRMDGRGFEVGPDISDVRNRSREALLYDILDPNQKLEPRFTDYLVLTKEGLVFNGLMVSETAEAVVLRQPGGKQSTIARHDIEVLKASGKSLMPEGVEKEVSVQQMADLLEYLKSRALVSSSLSK